MEKLGSIATEVGQVDDSEEAKDQGRALPAPIPLTSCDEVHRDRGRGHDAGDSHAVGAGKVRRAAEAQDQQHAAGPERPVDARHVDLALDVLRRVDHLHAREQVEVDAGVGEREGARDERLRGDHGGGSSESDHGVDAPGGYQAEERVVVRDRLSRQKLGALPEVVEQQAGENEREPADADGLLAEVAHVRVEGFAACHAEHDRPQHHDALAEADLHHEVVAVVGVDGAQHLGVFDDLVDTQDGHHDEPDNHDTTEDGADLGSAFVLDREQTGQDGDGQRDDSRLESRRRDFETFDGAQDGDGRRDQTFSVEKACREHQRQADATDGFARHAVEECEQAEGSTFAEVVGAEDEHHVLETDHQGQCPEDQRTAAEHTGFVDDLTDSVLGEKDLLEGVEDAGSDVAVDHAAGGEAKQQEGLDPLVVVAMTMMMARRLLRFFLGRRGRFPYLFDALIGHVASNPFAQGYALPSNVLTGHGHFFQENSKTPKLAPRRLAIV